MDHRQDPRTSGTGATGSPAYLSGLLLRDRDVLVVGAGAVATRRLARLLEVGARIRVVAPDASDAVVELDRRGRLAWQRRRFVDEDLDGAWYVVAATDSPDVNAAAAAGAEARRTFCVRSDDAHGGSAWTPAARNVADVTVAVIGNRDPRRSGRLLDVVSRALEDTAE